MTQERKGSWIQTATGRQFWPLDPRPEEIHIEDIARGLSMLCRYVGQVKAGGFISIAQHSFRVSLHCDPQDALWGLLHDAPEAYLGDVSRPLKIQLAMIAYREAEDHLMEVICQRYKLPLEMPESVKLADRFLLHWERHSFMDESPMEWTGSRDFQMPDDVLHSFPPDYAEMMFLKRFRELIAAREAEDEK